MMSCIAVNEHFSVSGPIDSVTESTLRAMGINTLINLRPDGEEKGRGAEPDWRKLAECHHWDYYYLPVESGHYGREEVAAFSQLIASKYGKVHAFCRTGTRALHMWLLAQQLHGASFEKLQDTARRCHVTMPVLK